MSQVQAIALNTFREVLRSKILYSVVAIAAAVVCAATLFGSVTIGSQVKVVKDFGLFALSFFGTLLAISAGTNLLNKELKYKTVYNILSKPVARWQFVAGKYLGLFAVVAVLDALLAGALILYAAGFEGRFDPLLLQGFLFALLEANIICAVTIFFSSLVVTTTLTGILTFATYISGRSVHYLAYFLSGDEKPALANVIRGFDLILPDLSLFAVGDRLVYGQEISLRELRNAVIYSISYSTILVMLAVLIFSRRELK
jgi:ABC-type transport system involved in multi-copper enzyme maturation permease subunit